MAYIDNSETKKELNDAIRGNCVSNIATNKLSDTIVPVIDINPKLLRRSNVVKSGVLTNATTSTIYTVPSDKEFYLVAAALAFIKDATATTTKIAINVTTDDGLTGDVLAVPSITLTASTGEISNSFPAPIKIMSEQISLLHLQQAMQIFLQEVQL